MSGHSKWSTIKREKQTLDQKRSQTFTKLASAITIAIKEGNNITDPASNFRLRLAIEKAKQANMPKDNIERAIERTRKESSIANFVEFFFEGFGPGGVAFLVQVATDNKNRTLGEIKNIFDKNGGKIGERGGVAYLFEQIFYLTISSLHPNLDKIILEIIDIGALDIITFSEKVKISVSKNNLNSIKIILENNKIPIENIEEIFKSINTIKISDQNKIDQINALREKLENINEVIKVYINCEIP